MRPVIGVIASYNPETRVLLVRENYLSMLRAEGGNPVLLPLGASGDALEAQLDMCSGVLLTGGDDVEPARYGEETLPCCGSMTLPRDAYEIELIRRAVERDIPMLGICRGIQVLNVALGGSLYQDVGTQVEPGASAHQQPEPYGEPSHRVTLAPGSPLERLWGVEAMPVNSMHHQAIKRLAESLAPMAFAPEGFVEAVDRPGSLYVRGVQWHPEYMVEPQVRAEVSAPQRAMIREFIEAAAEYARRQGGK